MDNSLRVFVSYSHRDQLLVEKIVNILKEGGITVLWSSTLSAAGQFSEEIKRFIEHAHVFMPILTEEGSKRGWVHQEIGYALGLHIPIFPVTTEEVIKETMLGQLHTIRLSKDEATLRNQLHINEFKTIRNRIKLPALYQKATRVQQRALMMKEYADNISSVSDLSHIDKYGTVRQKGGLSTFHIPDKIIGHQVWTDRYLPGARDSYHKEVQKGERMALQNHASKKGCKLIITPYYANLDRSDLAANTRLKTLIDFLENMPNDKVVIAMQNAKTSIESLTMVGDWFLAESVSYQDGDGFTHTFFTRNAAEIGMRIENFEAELNDLLGDLGWTESNSRVNAIEYLKGLLK
ncbi:MAG: toll/interleukin-1 receptor domain-containing protein [Saprospiraceae bacterium]|nr:toll/interleukin-1 receptor domain-containing protein [Saprospiraceae bacterium]